MENFQIPSNNPFDDRARKFLKSQQGQNLQRRYGATPYEDDNKVFETIAWLGSYFCNGISIVSASTWLFSYAYSIFMDVPKPFLVSGFITITLLLGLEILQRYFTTKYFKRYYKLKMIKDGMSLYGSSLYSLIIGMIICAGLSITASYLGGFDLVKVVSTQPIYAPPTLLEVAVIENRYQKLIDDAQAAVTDYASKRVWKGRLSSQDAKKYQDLLDRKLSLADEMLVQIKATKNENDKIVAEAKAKHTNALQTYQDKTGNRGSGLGIVAGIFIFLFYICMWFQEYFKFRTVSQYAILVDITPTPSVTQTLKTMPPSLTYAKQELNGNKRNLDKESHAFISTVNSIDNRHNGTQDCMDETTPVYTATQPCTQQFPENMVEIMDRYTIPHRSFKNGQLVHMNYGQIKNRVEDYARRVQEAEAKQDFVALANRTAKLIYWNSRLAELVAKAQVEEGVGS